ncbi:hypothetical protein Droror1_Dr00007479 [Drosera rotundifolia]
MGTTAEAEDGDGGGGGSGEEKEEEEEERGRRSAVFEAGEKRLCGRALMTYGAVASTISVAKQFFKLQSLLSKNQQRVPKGHVAIYVGNEERKRYVVPLTYLSHPAFKNLLQHAEEEFGFDYPMGGLTLPCKEDTFIDLNCRISSR